MAERQKHSGELESPQATPLQVLDIRGNSVQTPVPGLEQEQF